MSELPESYRRLTAAGDAEPFIDEFQPACGDCIRRGMQLIEKCPLDGRAARHTVVDGTYGRVFECTKKPNLVKAQKTHAATLNGALPLLRTLASYRRSVVEKYERAYKRLLHNVERNDAHIIQEFQNVVPEVKVSRNQGSYRDNVLIAMTDDPMTAAKAMLNIFKAAIAIKNEITIYQRLYVDPKWQEFRKSYKLHRLMMNTAYKFFDDFNARDIILRVTECYDEVEVDFECISVVLFHLMDNAQKYALHGSEIIVSFPKSITQRTADIELDMVSLATDPEEREVVMLEGKSGFYAQKSGRAGKGIGMSVVSDIIARTGLKFEVVWNYDGKPEVLLDDLPHTRNRFAIRNLPLTRIARVGGR